MNTIDDEAGDDDIIISFFRIYFNSINTSSIHAIDLT